MTSRSASFRILDFAEERVDNGRIETGRRLVKDFGFKRAEPLFLRSGRSGHVDGAAEPRLFASESAAALQFAKLAAQPDLVAAAIENHDCVGGAEVFLVLHAGLRFVLVKKRQDHFI